MLQHAVAAALANLHPQLLASRMPQQRDHLPLPVDLAAAAACVLAGDSGSSKARSSRRQQQQQQQRQQQQGCYWDTVGAHGLAGKPLWMCCGRLAVRCLEHLPALSVAAAVTHMSDSSSRTAAEAGALALVVPGSAAAGMQVADSLEDSLLSCLAHCCSGE